MPKVGSLNNLLRLLCLRRTLREWKLADRTGRRVPIMRKVTLELAVELTLGEAVVPGLVHPSIWELCMLRSSRLS